MCEWCVAAVSTMIAVAGCTNSRAVDQFVRVGTREWALTHVRTIDGTGRAGNDDQTILIRDGRILALGPSSTIDVGQSSPVLNLSGRTVMPGLVGMHDHLFYQLERAGAATVVTPAQRAFAMLYLASGVTTIRTTGTVDFDGDRRLKESIDGGKEPGPRIHLTGPYLNAVGAQPNPAAIASQVETAANQGATSFKAYTTLRLPELQAAIDVAHRRGFRVTGHLCAIGFREAAAAGIDNLEHGLLVDTEFYPEKRAGECPEQARVLDDLMNRAVTDGSIQELIHDLVSRRVALTSTLAVFESYAGLSPEPRIEALLAAPLQGLYRQQRQRWMNPEGEPQRMFARLLKMEMEFERAFVAAGGHLMAGADTTGWGGIVAGFGDQRELELLVDAGFTPEAAIQIATANGASFLGEPDIGTIAAGRRADLVVVRGDPSARMSDVRNVTLVVKEGVGYDPAALVNAAQGAVGVTDRPWYLSTRGSVAFMILLAIAVFATLVASQRYALRRSL